MSGSGSPRTHTAALNHNGGGRGGECVSKSLPPPLSLWTVGPLVAVGGRGGRRPSPPIAHPVCRRPARRWRTRRHAGRVVVPPARRQCIPARPPPRPPGRPPLGTLPPTRGSHGQERRHWYWRGNDTPPPRCPPVRGWGGAGPHLWRWRHPIHTPHATLPLYSTYRRLGGWGGLLGVDRRRKRHPCARGGAHLAGSEGGAGRHRRRHAAIPRAGQQGKERGGGKGAAARIQAASGGHCRQAETKQTRRKGNDGNGKKGREGGGCARHAASTARRDGPFYRGSLAAGRAKGAPPVEGDWW